MLKIIIDDKIYKIKDKRKNIKYNYNKLKDTNESYVLYITDGYILCDDNELKIKSLSNLVKDKKQISNIIKPENSNEPEIGEINVVNKITKLNINKIRKNKKLINDDEEINLEPVFMDNENKLFNCNGEQRSFLKSQLICRFGFIEIKDKLLRCEIIIDFEEKGFKIKNNQNRDECIPFSEVCFLIQKNKTNNFKMISFNIFGSVFSNYINTGDFFVNIGKLKKYIKFFNENNTYDGEIQDYLNNISSGNKSQFQLKVKLNLNDGFYYLYPQTFGFWIKQKSPLVKINDNKPICKKFDLDVKTMKLIMNFILKDKFPSYKILLKNLVLIKNLEDIYQVLNHLGIKKYPKFFRNLKDNI